MRKASPITMIAALACFCCLAICAAVASAAADKTAGKTLATRADVERMFDSTVHGWRFQLETTPISGAEAPDFDDSTWEPVDVGHQWWPHDSTCWYRARVTIPDRIKGMSVAGSTVRMRVDVDNEAQAYVNGEFKQHFKRADGDFVLTDKAHPGDAIVVALHGINYPGYGSLIRAYLTSSTGEEMANALESFLRDYDAARSYARNRAPEAAQRWENIVQASISRLDLDAYRSEDQASFLRSLEQAHGALLAESNTFEQYLATVEGKLASLKRLIEHGQTAGRQMAYQRADARMVESFLQYARDDRAESNFHQHVIRALDTARVLDSVCNEAIEAAQAILRDASLDLVVPVYQTGPIAVRDGAFWQGERPVFFTGVGHFTQARKDTPILTEYGLNIIQIEKGPNSVVIGPDKIDDSPIRSDIVATLDAAAKHNVMVNMLISPHYFPQWAIDRNPKLAQCGKGFMKHCIDAPESREIYQQYLHALMPLIAHHPALHSICLSNEPQYDGRCEYARDKYHAWLQNKYKRIEALNQICDTKFAAFNDVQPPDRYADYALYYDYCRFNQDRFLAFHEFLAKLIHEYDPTLPVHAKVMSHAFGDPGRFEAGIDYEAFTKLGAVAGNDCTQNLAEDTRGEYLQGWQDMALNYTLQHSVAPDEPIFNSEDHIIRDGEWRFIPEGHIRTAFWMQAIHGQGAATTWVWERAQTGDFVGNILTRANCVWAMGRVGLDLNRLGEEVHALQRVKGDMAILYAFSSMLPSSAFTEEASAAFEGAYFADTVCEFVTESQTVEGKLKDYRLVVVPNASHVPDGVVAALGRYIAAGGTVMTVGECFSHDEHGRTRTTKLEQAGSGRLVTYPDRLTPRAYREILNTLLDMAGCTRPVRMLGQYGEPIWGINLRTAEFKGKRLVNLLNFTRADQTIALTMGGHGRQRPVVKATDLFNNSEVSFPLTLRPLDPILLKLEKEDDAEK